MSDELPMINPNGGGRWNGEEHNHLSVRLRHALAEVNAGRNIPLSVLRDLLTACAYHVERSQD
jgi:hypothetical protein